MKYVCPEKYPCKYSTSHFSGKWDWFAAAGRRPSAGGRRGRRCRTCWRRRRSWGWPPRRAAADPAASSRPAAPRCRPSRPRCGRGRAAPPPPGGASAEMHVRYLMKCGCRYPRWHVLSDTCAQLWARLDVMYMGDIGDTASGGCDSVMTRWRPCGYSGQSSGGHSHCVIQR